MNIVFTNSPEEQEKEGRRIVSENPKIYTPETKGVLKGHIEKMNAGGLFAAIDPEKAFFRSVYDYWAYGSNIQEEFYFDFFHKSHKQKADYVTFRNRFLYMDHLNKKEDRALLDDKFALYQMIRPSFKRDVIKITSENDYGAFCDFLSHNPVFVIKPIDLGSAQGVRKYDATGISAKEKQKLFDDLLSEAKGYGKNESWGRGRPSMILEELIEQAKEMAVFHPASLQVLRIVTLNDGRGNIGLFRPWIKIGAHNSFTAAAATDGCCAEIDPETGELISDGFSEDGHVYKVHPDTGVPFRGYVIPDFKEAASLCLEQAKRFSTLRYIGWDAALSKNQGWCIVEANTQPGFGAVQMISGRGVKKEFQDLIGWAPEKQFWWE